MLSSLLQLDTDIFLWINRDLSNSLLNQTMPLLRSRFFWIPAYVWLTGWVAFRMSSRQFWAWFCALILCVAVSDTISSKIIKKTVQRTRPCNELRLEAQVKERIPCGVGYSFPSSHAANHMAMAQFIVLTLGTGLYRTWWKIAYLWAGIICFGQVYVGVHYPLDVGCGAILGLIVGTIIYKIWSKLKIE